MKTTQGDRALDEVLGQPEAGELHLRAVPEPSRRYEDAYQTVAELVAAGAEVMFAHCEGDSRRFVASMRHHITDDAQLDRVRVYRTQTLGDIVARWKHTLESASTTPVLVVDAGTSRGSKSLTSNPATPVVLRLLAQGDIARAELLAGTGALSLEPVAEPENPTAVLLWIAPIRKSEPVIRNGRHMPPAFDAIFPRSWMQWADTTVQLHVPATAPRRSGVQDIEPTAVWIVRCDRQRYAGPVVPASKAQRAA